MLKFYTGDDWIPSIQLLRMGQPFNIPLDSTIKAAMIEVATEEIRVGPVTCDNAAANAVWSESLITAWFTAATTVNVPIGQYILELEVTQSGEKQSYQTSAYVAKAYIP